jgi:hypothetical protein
MVIYVVYFSHFGMLYQEKSGNPEQEKAFAMRLSKACKIVNCCTIG